MRARLELEAIETAEAARNAERERVAPGRAHGAGPRARSRARTSTRGAGGATPAARALAEDGARLALSAVEIEPGAERAVAAALRSRAAAILADDPTVGLALLQRARAAGLGSLTVLTGRSPQDLVREYPVVPLDGLLDATVPSVTTEGFGYDPASGELWFVGETAEAVLLELQGRRSSLQAEAAMLEAQLEESTRIAGETADRARVAEAAYGKSPRLRPSRLDARLHARLVESATRLHDGIDGARRAAGRFEAPLRARVDAGSTRAGSSVRSCARWGRRK